MNKELFDKVVNAQFSLLMGFVVFMTFMLLAYGTLLWMNNDFIWFTDECCSTGVIQPWYSILSVFMLIFFVGSFFFGGYTIKEVWKWRCNL